MLCINSYTQEYINECRARVDMQLAAYQNLISAAGSATAISTFEPVFFNNLVLLLDNLFCHRSRAMEKKDGNPLNEVRLICESLLHHQSRMSLDKSIKFDPAKSVLKYQVGDEIKLSEGDFRRLAAAFFAEIESKYLLGEAVMG